MLSRHADDCFWIGRYVERAEATARMVDVDYHAALEYPLISAGPRTAEAGPTRWRSLLAITGSDAAYGERYENGDERNALSFFAFDLDNPSSVVSSWSAARDTARSIREQIASEMWESLNVAYLRLREWNVDRAVAVGPHAFFQEVKEASLLFQGILNRTMMMGEGRDWLDAGRFLERAGQTARLLDVKYTDLLPDVPDLRRDEPHGALDTHGWIALLKSVSAYEMFRRAHREGIRPASVVDFLVFESRFPASVRHGVGRVEGCLRRISGNQHEAPATEPERRAGRLRADLTYSDAQEILDTGLHTFLEGVQQQLAALGDTITETYLSY